MIRDMLYHVPVKYQMHSTLAIEANTFDEAIELAWVELENLTPDTENDEVIDGSFEVLESVAKSSYFDRLAS